MSNSSLAAIVAAVTRGESTAEAVASTALGRLEHRDPKVGAILAWDRERVLAQARAIDQRVAAGRDPGQLAGVPIAIKDNLCTHDLPTTCASRILADYRAPVDATVVARLRDAGAVILCKTNLDEFAMGASTESSAIQPTRNPHDLERVPGGSSGGSAAAVAAGIAPASLGSDTGGSVRQPAAFCGVVGFRPSYGAVSRRGLVAFASSLDQVGPLAHSVDDVERVFRVIAGPDDQDATCSPEPLPETDPVDLGQLVVGVQREGLEASVDPDVRAGFERAQQAFSAAGARLVEVRSDLLSAMVPTYYMVVTAEASSNLARFDGVRYGPRSDGDELADILANTRGDGFGDEVKRRILLGTFALTAGYADRYYQRALRVRRRIAAEYDGQFESVDVLLGPTTPTPAFKLGEKQTDPLELYLCDIFTAGAALAGLPAISLPAGAANGLPIGVQLQGPRRSDHRLLAIAAALEARLPAAPQPREFADGA